MRYTSDKHHPILFHARKKNITKTDLRRLCGVSRETFETWLGETPLIRLRELILISGVLGMPIEELVYILVRNKPNVDARLSKEKNGKWYIESIREKHK